MTEPTGNLETRSDLGTDPSAEVSFWLMQLRIAEKENDRWVKRGRSIVKRYRDDRKDNGSERRTTSKFNILWSNVETLKPFLYGRQPKPEAERRFKDPDAKARLAAEILERALAYEDDADDFDDMMKAVVEDRLLPGRGIARVRYVPHYGDPIQPDPEVEADGVGDGSPADDAESADGSQVEQPEQAVQTPAAPVLREVVWEEAKTEYVFWEDFRFSPARRWKEVWWDGFRSYMTRVELRARFGKEIGDKVGLDYTPGNIGEDDASKLPPDAYKKATVWEIWDKSRREVVWISPSYTARALDRKKDPLELVGFFPNPAPLFATTTNDKLVPVPDYVEYQDQAGELDSLTARLNKLMEALKVVGVYPGSEKQVISQMLDPGTENKLIPHEEWVQFVTKGGLDKMISWLPIENIAAVMIQLFSARDKVKQVIYETTGLSDILRANTNPNETLGAQELKSNFATMRLSRSQKDVTRFARDMVRLRGEVISRHFSGKTLGLMSDLPLAMEEPRPAPPAPLGGNAMMDPQQQAAYGQAMQQWQQAVATWDAEQARRQKEFDEAVALLRGDAGRGFRVDIETDSTVAADDAAEKQMAIEFVQAVGAYLQQGIAAAKGVPELAPLVAELLMFAVRRFKVGRTVEQKIQATLDEITAKAKSMGQAAQQQGAQQGSQQQGAPAPDPAAAAQAQGELALDNKKADQDFEIRKTELALDAHKIKVDEEDARARNTVAAARLISEESMAAHRGLA